MRRLAEQKALGALMVRLMMALHDFDISSHGNQHFGAARRAKRLGNWRTTAGRYFIRLQLSHLNEALNIVRQMESSDAFKGAVLGCDRDTQRSYHKLVAFLDSPDWVKMNTIRNKIGFHYDQDAIKGSLNRIERRRRRQAALSRKRPKVKGLRRAVDTVKIEVGRGAKERRYDPRELVEIDLIVHGIFDIKESDTYEEDRKLDEAAKKIQMRLIEMRNALGDFAYNFIRRYAQAS